MQSDATNGRAIPPGQRSSRRPIAARFGPRGALPVQMVPKARANEAPRADTAIVAAEQLERLQPVIRQIVGMMFMFIGLNGSIMALNGRFENWLAAPLIVAGTLITVLVVRTISRRSVRTAVLAGCVLLLYALNEVARLVVPWAITGGLVLQSIVTLFQWTYCRQKLHPYYLAAVAVDAGLNVRGYGLVMLAPLVAVLALVGGYSWWAIPVYIFWAAWGIIGVFSIAVAVFGEHILVRK